MYKSIQVYKSLIFDCDGVVLNSNQIKTKAFYEAAQQFGSEPAQALVDYHVMHGGISRYAKFEYFITHILQRPFDEELNKNLLERFASSVKRGLMTCQVTEGLDQLKAYTPNANWIIVSGGDQQELRDVFAVRDLAKYFDGGIFGSPETKDAILARETENGNITRPALYLGDSKYDYHAAMEAQVDFVFINRWSEVKDNKSWCVENGIHSFDDPVNLIQDII